MAAFSPVSSSQVVQDSRKQPGARLNDEVYDSMPRAGYDSVSKDILVLYTKTAPDTDYTPGSINRKLLDYAVGGEKIYSVNA